MGNASGRVIWITGLSGAGKTTLAKALLPHLPQPRLLLDGDEMRASLELLAGGYSCEERLKLALTYARLCALTAKQGLTVVCATISMFHEVRQWNRANLPWYFEVYLEASEGVRLERDYKKVYVDIMKPSLKAIQKPTQVVGHDLPSELPTTPDLILPQDGRTIEEELAQIIAGLGRLSVLIGKGSI